MIWNEVRPAGNVSRDWRSMAISPDGNIILAGCNDGLYRSNDGGVNWSLINNSGTVRAVAMSDNASHILIISDTTPGTPGFRLFSTTNGGSSWSEKTPLGSTNRDWFNVSVSSSGTKMVASINFQEVSGSTPTSVWISTNSGNSFSSVNLIDEKDPAVSALSKDGSVVLFATAFQQLVHKETNNSGIWMDLYPVTSTYASYQWLNVSKNGQVIYTYSTDFYPNPGIAKISYNGGSTWSSLSRSFRKQDISEDGYKSIMLDYDNDGYLYVANSPSEFTREYPGGQSSRFSAIAISGNGNVFGAGTDYIGSGRLYISGTPTPPDPVDDGNDVMMHHMQILGGIM